jgi:hypothetical protein
MYLNRGLYTIHDRVKWLTENYKQFERAHKPICFLCKRKRSHLRRRKNRDLCEKQCSGLEWVCRLKRNLFGNLPDWAEVSNRLITSSEYSSILQRMMVKYRPERTLFLLHIMNKRLKKLQPHMKRVCDVAEDLVYKMYKTKDFECMSTIPNMGEECFPYKLPQDYNHKKKQEVEEEEEEEDSDTGSDVDSDCPTEELEKLFEDISEQVKRTQEWVQTQEVSDYIDLTHDEENKRQMPGPHIDEEEMLITNTSPLPSRHVPSLPLSKSEKSNLLTKHKCGQRCFHPTLISELGPCSWKKIQKEIEDKLAVVGWHCDPCKFCQKQSLAHPSRWIDCTGDPRLDEFKFEMFQRFPHSMECSADEFLNMAVHCRSLISLQFYTDILFEEIKYVERAFELYFEFIYWVVVYNPHMQKYIQAYEPLLLRNYITLPEKPISEHE